MMTTRGRGVGVYGEDWRRRGEGESEFGAVGTETDGDWLTLALSTVARRMAMPLYHRAVSELP